MLYLQTIEIILDIVEVRLVRIEQYSGDKAIFYSVIVDGEDENFSVENVAKKLRYGCRVASRSVRKKEIVVANCNLGLTEYVVVETIHGKKFMVLPFKFIWAILPL